MFSLPPYLVNHKTSYTSFYPLKRIQLLFVGGNEMHLKESKWTLRCGNRVSAYFLNHNCLAFGEKVFAYLYSVLMAAFLEG